MTKVLTGQLKHLRRIKLTRMIYNKETHNHSLKMKYQERYQATKMTAKVLKTKLKIKKRIKFNQAMKKSQNQNLQTLNLHQMKTTKNQRNQATTQKISSWIKVESTLQMSNENKLRVKLKLKRGKEKQRQKRRRQLKKLEGEKHKHKRNS